MLCFAAPHAGAQLIANVQVNWTYDYTPEPDEMAWSGDGDVIGGGYCTVHIHLPAWFPVAIITSLTATADACDCHGGKDVAITGPTPGPVPRDAR